MAAAPSPGSEPIANGEVGAYGLGLRGLDAARSLLVPAEENWPVFDVLVAEGVSVLSGDYVGRDEAALRLQTGGEMRISAGHGRIELIVPRALRTDEVLHPYLGPAAAVIARWFGRESFHGGAFVVDGGSWAVLAGREGGKSSTLARLALSGQDVLCDDLLVVSRESAFAGPRTVDLREEAARLLGAGEPLGVIGARERWRLTLPREVDPGPLRGWIFLEWGEQLETRVVSGATLVERLLLQRGIRLPPVDPDFLFELGLLPAWEVRRPRGWETLDATVESLLAVTR